MKKGIALVLALMLALGALAGCGGAVGEPAGGSSGTAGSGSEGEAAKAVKIGVLQFVGHPALDAAYEGFKAALAEAGYVEGDNVTFDYQNAQGDMGNCSTMASTLVNGGCDLILAIATPAAQAVASATEERQEIPVLVTAVTDPEDAGLVESNEMPGRNITGTSDLTPVKQQMELLTQLVPEAKTIGFLYSSNEVNSEFQIKMAREAAEGLGLAYEEFTVSNSNEVQLVAQSMLGKVDAVYSPTDNIIAQTVSTVAQICIDGKLPFIVGEVSMVEQGGLASYSVDYLLLGRITGEQAVEILKNGAKPAEMPIRYQEEYELVINEDTAAALEIEIPEELLA